MKNNEKIFLVLLHSIWITHKKLHLIFTKNNNYREVYENINKDFLLSFWFTLDQINKILDNKKNININNINKKLNDRKVEIICYHDNNYPVLLKELFSPPFLLYVRWKIDNSPKISIVWSRKISNYWEEVIKKIVPDISKYFTIVSGWALWCDSLAHIETLKSWNKTISIIWTWIDIDYPVSNKKLYDEIVEKWWAVISVFPLWEFWNVYNFPIRNEIVASLSVWVLIIEAWEKSWTLITANQALDLWKDLFVVPWDIFKKNCIWTNNLIKNWNAKLITCSDDILCEYNIVSNKELKKEKNINFIDKIEQDIYDILLLNDLCINELSKKLELDISTLLYKIWFMEINNYIKKWNWWKYQIK